MEHVAPSKKPGIITSINNLNINDNIQLKCKHAKMQTTKNKMQSIENPKRI
ncbi:hypothetical protein BOH78_2970 [Pichia kudriavzevii]|uniref:Uncharacterized protein n=1 Tax=Pichia kudriavzevii TaxID=4909 RepID=A0A1V2LL66_PICKU|nr:hypothetical protein BOH78_2970 [Pichia kudriavzevii]